MKGGKGEKGGGKMDQTWKGKRKRSVEREEKERKRERKRINKRMSRKGCQ